MSIQVFASLIMLSDHEGQILLCQSVEKDFYFLPSAKIEPGQPAQQSLSKYMEKCGAIHDGLYFIGVAENVFKKEDKLTHEYRFVFKTENCLKAPNIPENGCDYGWHDISQLPTLNFKPQYLKTDLIRWLKGEEIYFSSNSKIDHH